MRQGGRQRDTLRPGTQQHPADIPHPAGAHGILVEADFLPLSVRINAAAGDGNMNVRVPVKPASVGMDSAENTDIQAAQTGGIQQVIDRQTAEVVKQPAVDFKQRPQGIGQGENQMLPVTVRQPVKLGGNPQIGGLFAAGRAGTAVAGVGDVSDMPTTGIIAAIFLHAGDAGAAGEHFGDSFHFDIAHPAGIEKGGPALVSRKEFFERTRGKTGKHGEKSRLSSRQAAESPGVITVFQYSAGDRR